jgi:hypothetical protein
MRPEMGIHGEQIMSLDPLTVGEELLELFYNRIFLALVISIAPVLLPITVRH